MALELDSRYPGRFKPGDADYPQGSFKNRTAPGTLDGSYLEKDWANDKEGFFQRLLLVAGISPNGGVDTALASQYYDALVQIINDQASVPSNILTSGIQGSFSNLKASATGTSATVTVTADAICLKNASNEQVVINALALAINSATVGANGLDTGVLAASTWYSVWVIWNGTTTAGLLSLSTTSPTLPPGYTHKARVGWIRTDGTGNKYPLSYVQMGEDVQYVVAAGTNVATGRVMASGTAGNVSTPTYVAVAVGAFVPPTASLISVNVSAQSSLEALVAPNASYGGKFSQTNPAFYGSGNGGGNASNIRMVLESTNIYWASTGAALICTGYRENR